MHGKMGVTFSKELFPDDPGPHPQNQPTSQPPAGLPTTSCKPASKVLTRPGWLLTTAKFRTSLVVQWLRILLPMQGTRVRVLVWEDPTCRGATKPVHHNY